MSYLLNSTVTGTGEPIVLLHGFLSSGQYFKHIRKDIEKTNRVITIDLLGFGKSPKPRLHYTYDEHLSAINYTLASLGVKEPFILLGHSMGALLALRYAIQNPGAIKKLLLFNPPLFVDLFQMEKYHKATARRYRIMLYSRARHALWPLLKAVPRHNSERRRAINLTDIIRMSRHAREGSYRRIIGEASSFRDLQDLNTPTLLVVGKHDRGVYLENLANQTLSPYVELAVIDADHHPLVRNVKLSSSLIKKFI